MRTIRAFAKRSITKRVRLVLCSPYRLGVARHCVFCRRRSRARRLGRDIAARLYPDRLDETVFDPGNVFQPRRRGMPEREMDVDLAHVADMGDDRQTSSVG